MQVGADHLRQELCYLGHLPGVTGYLSVAENLDYLARLSGCAWRMRPAEALLAVGLAELGDLPAQRLSAGQRQRLALARFILLDSPLWIMDEPLTALDRHGQQMVEQMLGDHARRGGVAIVSTHHALAVPAAHLRRYEFGARLAA